MLGTRTPENGAGIVSFRKPGIERREIVRQAPRRRNRRRPARRLGPHLAPLLHQPRDIDRMLEELP